MDRPSILAGAFGSDWRNGGEGVREALHKPKEPKDVR